MPSCPRCQHSIPDPAPSFCPQCGAAVLGLPPESPTAPPSPPEAGRGVDAEPPELLPAMAAASPGPRGTPWERRDRLGLLQAFVETARAALFSPTEFFRSIRPGRGIGEVLVYGVVVGWLGQLVAALYQLILTSVTGSGWTRDADLPAVLRPYLAYFEGVVGFLLVAFFGWFFILLGLFIWSGLVHLSLMLLGGARRGFETSFSVSAYAETAMLWGVIPFCGGLVVLVHWIALNAIGLSEAHGISRGLALAAVFLPLLVCCCCVPGLAVGLIGGLGAAIGSMG